MDLWVVRVRAEGRDGQLRSRGAGAPHHVLAGTGETGAI